MILLAVLYFALSLPENAPLQWLGPLTRIECELIERKTSETWCQAIQVPPKSRPMPVKHRRTPHGAHPPFPGGFPPDGSWPYRQRCNWLWGCR